MREAISLPRDRLRRLVAPGTRALLRSSVWGLVDHGLMSATNFVTTVLVARVLTPREFGLYALAYTGLLFANSLQSALIVQPQMILGATRSGTTYVRYTTDTAWTQVILAALTALVAGLVALLALVAHWQVAPLLLAFMPATIAWQLQEFIRRALYTQSDVAAAVWNDLVSYGGQIVLVAALWRAGVLTPVTAVLALAGTSFLGVLLGLWQMRAQLDRHLSWRSLRATTRLNWDFGKWLLGGTLAWWTSAQIYPIFAAGLIGAAATGQLRAVQTILGPAVILMSALEPLFGARAAREVERSGLPALRRLVWQLQLVLATLMGGYCLVIVLFARQILSLVYGPAYSGQAWLLVIVALTYMLGVLRAVLLLALKAIGETNAIFRAYLASTAANLTLGLVAVKLFGLAGAGMGLMLNELVLQAVVGHFYLRRACDTSLRGMLDRLRSPARGRSLSTKG